METKITKIADDLENTIVKLDYGLEYNQIVKIAITTAERVKESHPMYIGKLNPKWALWHDVGIELISRLY